LDLDFCNTELDWIKGFGQAIDLIDSANGPAALLDAIKCVAPYDMGMVLIYRSTDAPILICDTINNNSVRKALGRFIETTYVLNPLYNAIRSGLTPGVYRIRDLAPDDYLSSEVYRKLGVHLQPDEELGYRTKDWPQSLEEVLFAIALPGGYIGEISLSRRIDLGGFNDEAVNRLMQIEPLVTALLSHHWRQNLQKTKDSEAKADNPTIQLQSEKLSARENEVVQLILKGHSSESIGSNLGISKSTVKTHRHNIYSKLAISSQQELFTLFLEAQWLRFKARSSNFILTP
jgi:DNA-binding CsgD family transcriptional regulator